MTRSRPPRVRSRPRSRKPGAGGAPLSPRLVPGLLLTVKARAAGPGMAAAAEPGTRAWLGDGSSRPGSPACSPVLGAGGRARLGAGRGSGSGSGPEQAPGRAGDTASGPAVPSHSFRKVTLTKPTFCHLCSDFIWGLAGFLCDGERAPPRTACPRARPRPVLALVLRVQAGPGCRPQCAAAHGQAGPREPRLPRPGVASCPGPHPLPGRLSQVWHPD